MKKNKILVVLISLLVIFLSITINYYSNNINQNNSVDDLILTFDETKSYVSSTDITPGWTASKEFSVENKGKESKDYNIIFDDLTNSFVTEGHLMYKITSTTGGYNMTNFKDVPKGTKIDIVLGYNIVINAGSKHEYKIEYKYIDDNNISSDINKQFSGSIKITQGTDGISLKDKLLADKPTRRIQDFNDVYTVTEDGAIFVTDSTEDGSTVYFFSGNSLDNWVKYGKDKNGNDLYWRIIRTNEDGSVRLLYSGNGTKDKDVSISVSSGFIDLFKYGYMYGEGDDLADYRLNTTNSEVKTTLDNWYKENICKESNSSCTNKDNNNVEYDDYLSKTAIYCNDRSYVEKNGQINFGAYERYLSKTVSYKCGANTTGGLFENASNADKFSVSTTRGGNGDLTYPIALMTADELVLTGNMFKSSARTWHTYNGDGSDAFTVLQNWGLLSASSQSNGNLVGFTMNLNNFSINESAVLDSDEFDIRPVVSIKSCATWESGDGTFASPYVVSVSSKCAAAEN